AARLRHGHGQRLLREDALDVPVLAGGVDERRLSIRWDGDVDHLDLGVAKKLVIHGIDLLQAVLRGDGAGGFGVARGDGNWVESRLTISHQMTVANNEAGAEAADAEVHAARQARAVVQGEVHLPLFCLAPPLPLWERGLGGEGIFTCTRTMLCPPSGLAHRN